MVKGLLALGITLFVGASAAVPLQSSPPQTNTFWNDPAVLRLEALKPVFKGGEPVLIKISALNRSSGVIDAAPVTPWEATYLVLIRNGHTLLTSGSPSGIRNRGIGSETLRPGESWIYQAWADQQPYTSVTNWGYWKVPPGNYIIVAVPEETPIMVRGDKHWTSIHDPSDAVEFTVES
jgi:hypothetical protein